MSHRMTGSTSGVGAIDGGPVTAVAGMALIFNFVGLYAFTGVALCVFGYIVLTLMLSSRAGRSTKNSGSAEAGTAVLILSWVVALVGGALVGGFHWVRYAHAAYVVLGLYASAVLIWLAGRAFSAFWSSLFPLAGVAMFAAVMHLGSPPGADDMEKSENWTPVTVTALDGDGQPIEGATVYLDLFHFWQGEPPLEGDRPWWSKATTGTDGSAHMALHEDPRFKRLLVRVRREPSVGYNEPTTIGEYIGYVDAQLRTHLPAPKAPYAFQLVMDRRPHPDSALLAIGLASEASSESSVARSVRLVFSTEVERLRSESGRPFEESALTGKGPVRDLWISGLQRLVLKLDSDVAGRPLTLHVLERGWTRSEEGYVELQRLEVAPMGLGEERVLPAIVLPSLKSAQTAEVGPGADRR